MKEASIAGVGMLPCAKHSKTPLADLGAAAAQIALDDAQLPYEAIGEVFTSSMMAPPQTALQVALRLGRTGVPVTAIESASSGGLVALRHAAWAVWSGRCEYALAIGYEKVSVLEPGGAVPAPNAFWDHFTPHLTYAIDATRFMQDHGVGAELFAAVAAKSWNAARSNPFALRQVDHEVTIEEVLAARPVATPLTRMMCNTLIDGAAAAVVQRGAKPGSVKILSIEQSSMGLDAGWPEIGPTVGPPSQTALAAHRAYEVAGISPSEIGVISLHDMAASEEVTTLVALGLGTEREIIDLVFHGGLELDGKLPTNLDGGCLARGHTSGANALSQILEVVQQLRGRAVGHQVANVHTGVVQAIGGGGSCVVAVLRGC